MGVPVRVVKFYVTANPLFIHEHWDEYSEEQKTAAAKTGFLSKLPLELLPSYQASDNQVVREAANQHVQECLEKLSAEELPDFLTDADPAIRKVAQELMEKAPHG